MIRRADSSPRPLSGRRQTNTSSPEANRPSIASCMAGRTLRPVRAGFRIFWQRSEIFGASPYRQYFGTAYWPASKPATEFSPERQAGANAERFGRTLRRGARRRKRVFSIGYLVSSEEVSSLRTTRNPRSRPHKTAAMRGKEKGNDAFGPLRNFVCSSRRSSASSAGPTSSSRHYSSGYRGRKPQFQRDRPERKSRDARETFSWRASSTKRPSRPFRPS